METPKFSENIDYEKEKLQCLSQGNSFTWSFVLTWFPDILIDLHIIGTACKSNNRESDLKAKV